MTAPADLLLGRIALEHKLLTRDQLVDCLEAQAATTNGSAPNLEQLLVDRGYVKPAELGGLIEERKKRLSEAAEIADPDLEDALLARILVRQGLTTEREVAECMRRQSEMAQAGKEVVRLGQLLVRQGCLRAETITKAVLICPACGARFAALSYDPLKTYLCKKCDGTLVRDTKTADDTLLPVSRRPMPDDVAAAMKNAANRFAGGKYILVREVGRGGMGVVWKAWQSDLERYVAIKQMSSGLWGEPEIKRFFREAQLAANLSHTNIATIYEVGVTEGKHWIAMEYVEGEPLSAFQFRAGVGSRLGDTRYGTRGGSDSRGSSPRSGDSRPGGERQPSTRMGEIRSSTRAGDVRSSDPFRRIPRSISLEQAVRILRDASQAVDYAHSKGVVHRDVKPHNIMVAEGGRVYVMDFGLAKPVKGKEGITMGDQVLGTPPYMSPEQARGEAVDKRTDIYSLGAVLYYVLTGRPPHQGNSPAETLMDVLSQDPELPSKSNPTCPPDLERIAMKCLEKDRHRRYKTAKEFADDLQRFRNGEPISVRPMSPLQHVAKAARNHPILAGTLIAVAAVAGGLWLVLGSIEASARAQVQQHLQQAETALGAVPPDRALALAAFVRALALDPENAKARQGYERCLLDLGDLAASPREWRRKADDLYAAKSWAAALAIYDRILKEGPPDTGEIHRRMGDCRKGIQREADEAARLRKTEGEANAIIEGAARRRDIRIQAMALQDSARASAEAAQGLAGRPGREGDAAARYREAELLLNRALAIDPDYVEAMLLRARIRLRQGDPEGAWQDARLALKSSPTASPARFELAVAALADYAVASNLPYDAAGDRPSRALERLDKAAADAAADATLPTVERTCATAMLALARNRPEEMLEALSKIGVAGTGRRSVHFVSAFARLRVDDVAEALRAVDAMLDADPLAPEGLYLRAILRIRRSDADGASADASRLLAFLPDNVPGLLARALAHELAGRTDAAADDLESASKLDRGLAERLKPSILRLRER